jgi:hypothetical protein
LMTACNLADMRRLHSAADRLSQPESVQAMLAPTQPPVPVVHNREAASW